MLEFEDNLYASSREIASKVDFSRTSVLKFLHCCKYLPSMIHLVHQLSSDDLNRLIEFCEVIENGCNKEYIFFLQLPLKIQFFTR